MIGLVWIFYDYTWSIRDHCACAISSLSGSLLSIYLQCFMTKKMAEGLLLLASVLRS